MASIWEIPLRPATPQKMHISLSGTDFTLWFVWNRIAQLWCMDIGDTTETPLLQGVALVTGANLLAAYGYLGIPGQLICQGAGNPDATPGWSDLGVGSHLFWIG